MDGRGGVWEGGKVPSPCRGASLLLSWGPQSLRPHPFSPGCPNEPMPMTYPEWGARGSFLGCPVAHSGRTCPPSPSGPEEFFLYKETFPSAQLGRLSEHLGLRALGEGGAQGCGAGILAVSKAILLILLRGRVGQSCSPSHGHWHFSGDPFVQRDCLGLSTVLAAGIPGSWPSSAARS